MAIVSSVQPRQIWRNVIAGIVCLGLGVWGLYDYMVKIPGREALVLEHRALTSEKDALAAKQARGDFLSKQEIERYEAVVAELGARFKEAPIPPAPYDRAVQLWVYVIGCGVLGVPFFIWPLITLPRKRYVLEDDGTLRFPEGTCALAEVKAIDMSRWMEKSIAKVTLADGAVSALDDYKYRNLHLIVGAIAHRLHPDEWTDEARPVKRESQPAATEREEQEVAADDGT